MNLAAPRAISTVLSTHGYQAILTHKQADVLSYLWADGEDEPVECGAIAECFHELNSCDLAEGRHVHYVPPTWQSIYATLVTLERRGLVRRVDRRDPLGNYIGLLWTLTPDGVQAARRYCL